jgi:hypothetical protein
VPNIIQAEHYSSAALTITLASLASSTSGVGRQATFVDNTDLYQMIRVYFDITTGTSPTTGKTIQFYLLNRDDHSSPNISTDNAGSSDAGLTIVTAPLVYVVQTDATSDKHYRGSFLIRNPGTSWAIAIVHDTGVALNATGSNHSIRYCGENVEVQ